MTGQQSLADESLRTGAWQYREVVGMFHGFVVKPNVVQMLQVPQGICCGAPNLGTGCDWLREQFSQSSVRACCRAQCRGWCSESLRSAYACVACGLVQALFGAFRALS